MHARRFIAGGDADHLFHGEQAVFGSAATRAQAHPFTQTLVKLICTTQGTGQIGANLNHIFAGLPFTEKSIKADDGMNVCYRNIQGLGHRFDIIIIQPVFLSLGQVERRQPRR